MYQLKFTAYCGMETLNRDPVDTEAEARAEAAKYLRAERKKGMAVFLQTSGEGWEVQAPEEWGRSMVGDDEGTLRIKHITFECRECGQQHETKDARDYCCSEQEQIDTAEPEPPLPEPKEIADCIHCGRRIWLTDAGWIDPEATGDDSIWSETCDKHDTFTAEHEPSTAE